jgi:hypothetical protein
MNINIKIDQKQSRKKNKNFECCLICLCLMVKKGQKNLSERLAKLNFMRDYIRPHLTLKMFQKIRRERSWLQNSMWRHKKIIGEEVEKSKKKIFMQQKFFIDWIAGSRCCWMKRVKKWNKKSHKTWWKSDEICGHFNQ